MARRLLQTAGYDVVGEAADGASAMQSVRQLRPDLVLLDIQLPDVDGCDVAQEERVIRVHWFAPVTDASGVRRELIRLAREARGG